MTNSHPGGPQEPSVLSSGMQLSANTPNKINNLASFYYNIKATK